MKLRYLLLLLILFSFKSPVYAEVCDSDNIARLKNLAEHVDVSYTLTDYNQKTYTIKISNINEELYAILTYENNGRLNFKNIENTNEIIQSNISQGPKKLLIYSKSCKNELKSIKLNLLYYNNYYENEKCKVINEQIEVCKKWTKQPIDESKFQNGIKKYYSKEITISNNLKLIKLISDNLIYITIGIIALLFIIIMIIKINNKKRKLE